MNLSAFLASFCLTKHTKHGKDFDALRILLKTALKNNMIRIGEKTTYLVGKTARKGFLLPI